MGDWVLDPRGHRSPSRRTVQYLSTTRLCTRPRTALRARGFGVVLGVGRTWVLPVCGLGPITLYCRLKSEDKLPALFKLRLSLSKLSMLPGCLKFCTMSIT